MALRVYNTLSKQKESFEPVQPRQVGMYLCGPTVYKPAHIGHLVGPVIFDAIKRYLTYKGFKVRWIVNITDVDDKIIDSAREQKTTTTAVAEKYTRDYLEILGMLGIDSIDAFPKASEHIGEIKNLCQKLIDKGFAYAAEGNVYFDVAKDADYGKLSHRKLQDQETGTRDLEGSGKHNAADFAVWKAAKPGEPSWDSPWGQGRPGWHIECSAMSMKYLGETLDIHGGGMDLLFPHHENELAQSESASGKPFVKLWLHNGLTRLQTKLPGGAARFDKISKSLGNVIDARDFVASNGPDYVRYLLLSTHYRSMIDLSDDVLTATKKGLAVFNRLFERVERLSNAPLASIAGAVEPATADNDFARQVKAFQIRFVETMDDDFNSASAIAVMHELASHINAFVEREKIEQTRTPATVAAVVAATQALKNLGGILGLFRVSPMPVRQNDTLLDGLMKLMLQLRQDARQDKNFALADNIRKGLMELGVTIEDRADGTIWRRE